MKSLTVGAVVFAREKLKFGKCSFLLLVIDCFAIIFLKVGLTITD